MIDVELLKKAKEQNKMTFDDLSSKSGIPKSTLYDIFRGITTAPRIDTMEAIQKALGIGNDIKAIGGFEIPQDKYAIPLLGQVVCGKPIESPENFEGYIYIDYKNPDEYFALKVQGDSMIGAGITQKSILIVHKQNYAEDGDIVVASINGESTTKRFKKQNDTIFLMPENSAYSPILVTKDSNFYIFGKVVEIRTVL